MFDPMGGDAHDLLCASVSLSCPDCCALLWAWFISGCLKLLVVFEETCRDASWFNCKLNFPHTSVAVGLSSVMQAVLPFFCSLNTLARLFPKVVLLLTAIVTNVVVE